MILDSSHATLQQFGLVARPLMACVWELVVINFERAAWVETILCATPERQAYLDRRLSPGLY